MATEGFDSVCSRVAEPNNDDSLAFERRATTFLSECPKDPETGKELRFEGLGVHVVASELGCPR